MNALEKKILKNIRAYGPLDFPGGRVRAYSNGKCIVDLSFGKVWDYYDLASLTKVLFTTSLVMKHVEDGALSLGRSLKKDLHWYGSSGTTLRTLLNHSAGLEDWKPFYKKIDADLPSTLRRQQLRRQLRQCAAVDREDAVYSDIGFLLIGDLLEQKFHLPLEQQWFGFISDFFSGSKLHFCAENHPRERRSLYAPTEACPWRGKTLQGEVHDDNCWSFGGVSTHAGLFGRMDDVSNWVLKIRKIEMGKAGFVKPQTLRQFTKASMPLLQGAWGLGFMKPSAKSTAGLHFSPQSYGHTGFTGTSIWMDPVKDLQVVLLSNRVCPTRTNTDFQKLRPQIHNWICESL